MQSLTCRTEISSRQVTQLLIAWALLKTLNTYSPCFHHVLFPAVSNRSLSTSPNSLYFPPREPVTWVPFVFALKSSVSSRFFPYFESHCKQRCPLFSLMLSCRPDSFYFLFTFVVVKQNKHNFVFVACRGIWCLQKSRPLFMLIQSKNTSWAASNPCFNLSCCI